VDRLKKERNLHISGCHLDLGRGPRVLTSELTVSCLELIGGTETSMTNRAKRNLTPIGAS
jgi:hypothetical protein